MTTSRFALASAAALAVVFYAATASATVATIALPDIVETDARQSIVVPNTGQTYTGNGFVGMRPSNEFIHAFAIENTQNYATKVLAQADISAFAGATINSATLSFVFLDGLGAYDMTATGFAGAGAIGYQFTAPAVTLASMTAAIGPGANSFDVTDIVAQAVAADTSWLNLLLEGSGCCAVTLTQSGVLAGRTLDSALLRLTVDYTAATPGGGIPEPSTWAMLLTGFAGMGAALRARRSRAVAA